MKDRGHYGAVALIALAVGLLFLREPGFGDDLTYWSFGFDLHERGLAAWQRHSFHDLRWPVWGICWLLQCLPGISLSAYFGEPIFYLILGALVAFSFARRLEIGAALAWTAAIAFLFHPLLDTVCYRPMPDLSEGVWGGVVLLTWWAMMRSETRERQWLFAALTGLSIYVMESNRITGIFIVPVLLVATLLFFPRRFTWLVISGVFAAVFYVFECAFYQWLFDDWLHNLHANLGAAGNKGTETIPLWFLPLRFLDSLWKASRLAPAYCLLGALGLWAAWRKHGLPGRLVVLWFVTLYLEYSCAPQSLFPYRPLIRDADRFLCGLTIPMSILAALGLFTLFQPAWLGRWKATAWLSRRPALVGAAALILLYFTCERDFCDLGFVPQMRRYLAALPDNTRVFSHKAMREIAFLADAKDARRFQWEVPNEILHRTDKLEALAASCDEFWYARKLVWLTTRKRLEKKTLTDQSALASYFEAPEKDWVLTAALAKGDTPDLIFYRRRTESSPRPVVLGPEAPEFQHLIPPLPATWERNKSPVVLESVWNIPENLRGKLVRFEVDAASDQVEAVNFKLLFEDEASHTSPGYFLLKPYLYAEGGKEFFVLQMPAKVTRCRVEIKFSKRAKRVEFTKFRAVIEAAAPL